MSFRLKVFLLAILLLATFSAVRCDEGEDSAVPPPPPPPPEEDIVSENSASETNTESEKAEAEEEGEPETSDVPVPPPPPPASESEDAVTQQNDDAEEGSDPEAENVITEPDAHPDDLLHSKEVTRRFFQLKDMGYTQEEAWDYADMELRIKELTTPGHAKYFSTRERRNFKHQLEKLHQHISHLERILAKRQNGEEVSRSERHDSKWTDASRAKVIELRKKIEQEDRLPLRLSLQRQLYKIYRDHKIRHREL